MRIENVGSSRVFTILDAPGLDPITVVLQDVGPERGRLIVECWGKAWSAYWGAMGERSIERFLMACDREYIQTKLTPGRMTKTDAAYLGRIVSAVHEALSATPSTEKASIPDGAK